MKWGNAGTAGLVLAIGMAFGAPSPGVAQVVLAARVNGAAIPLDRVDRQFEELLRERRLNIARMNNPAAAKGIKREALDNLIRIEVMSQAAEKAGLAVSDREVDGALAAYRAQFRTPEAYVRRIEQLGFGEPGFRAHMRKLMAADRYAEKVVERDVKVSEQDIDEFYEINPRLFKRAEQVKVRQILVALAPDAPADARAKALAQLQELAARVRAGEPFDALARRHSDDATRQWGGEMDPFARGEKHPAFDDAAFALKPGEVSAPVQTPRGLHLIRLDERLPASAVPLAEVRDRIRERLRATRGAEAIAREVEQLRDQGRIEVLTPL